MALTPIQDGVLYEENYPFVGSTLGAKVLTVTIAAETRDSGSAITTQLRPGLVLGETSTAGVFVDAEDSAVVANVKPAVTSSEDVDSDWQSATVTVEDENAGYSVTVTLAADDDTAAEVVTALNGDTGFNNKFVASAATNKVVITAREQHARLKVTSSLATAFGASGQTDEGTLTRHVILSENIPSVLNQSGTAVTRIAETIEADVRARESLLTGLTAEARQYFKKVNIQLV